jgi:hypothetical protein
VLGDADLCAVAASRPDDPPARVRAAVRGELALVPAVAAALAGDGLRGLGPVAGLFGFAAADIAAGGAIDCVPRISPRARRPAESAGRAPCGS